MEWNQKRPVQDTCKMNLTNRNVEIFDLLINNKLLIKHICCTLT